MGKSKDQKETDRERALADVARQQMADFTARWQPQQQRLARTVVDAGKAGSWQRRRGETMAKADTSAAFAGARQKTNTAVAASGQTGTTAHKLALAGLDSDQATSSGLAAVAADQGADDTMVSGLNAVTALGRGEKATAVDGMARSAAISAAQAEADAERSFSNRAGNARLAGQLAGVGAGLYMGGPAAPDPGRMSGNRIGLDGAQVVRRGQIDG